jgi:hypothetical protein
MKRKLHNEEIHNFSSQNIRIRLRRMRWAGSIARIGKTRNVYNFFFGKPEGKRPFWRARSRWKNNFKIPNREGVSVNLAQWWIFIHLFIVYLTTM